MIRLEGHVSDDGKIRNGKTQSINTLTLLESAASSGTHVIKSVSVPKGMIRMITAFKNKVGCNFRIYKLKKQTEAVVRLVEIG
jgi:hypothetical protein